MNGIKKEIKRISKRSGYSYKFLMNIYKETLKDDGKVNMELFEGISMEHDW